ncbi:MAG: hypothetical protein KAT31_05255 [Bacteroidales bacterium]|nr:hypothetical protein [Bacteroidales bacterium]
MEKDPHELTNLAVDPHYSGILLRLRKQAVNEFRDKDGDFVDFLPAPMTQSLH